jgi:ribosomal protein S18 acetylase RimI-like enzyme
VTVRPAKPSYDDGLAFAKYLDEAAEGYFRLLIGKRSDIVIATAFVETGHDLSHEHAVVAELEGVIVGMACGYSDEQHRHSSDEPLRRAAGGLALRMNFIGLLSWPLIRVLGPHGDDEFYLQSIAVDGGRRRMGIGTALMDAMEERARAGRMSSLTLHVSARNERARMLYERRGMSVVATWPGVSYLPSVVHRMSKSL